MQRTALITGSGMDSKTLTHLLLSKGYKVYVGTRRNTVFQFEDFEKIFKKDLLDHPQSSLKTLYMDISDQESVSSGIKTILEHSELHEVYHLAAASHVGYSYSAPVMNIQTNGMSSFFILDSIQKLTSKTRYYFASTTEMFSGKISDHKYTEEAKLYPKTPYGISKCLGFYWTQYFRETYGIFALSGILANHSNEYRHESFFIKKITQAAAKIAAGIQKDVTIGHLNWARDEFWADFGMEAAYKMLQMDTPEDLIIGNGNTRWGEEYISLAFQHFNLDWKKYTKYDDQFIRKNEVVKLEVDTSLAKEKIGWKSNRMPFEDHISIMCDWDYKKAIGENPERVNVFEKYS